MQGWGTLGGDRITFIGALKGPKLKGIGEE